jgi:hypothetical protein
MQNFNYLPQYTVSTGDGAIIIAAFEFFHVLITLFHAIVPRHHTNTASTIASKRRDWREMTLWKTYGESVCGGRNQQPHSPNRHCHRGRKDAGGKYIGLCAAVP